MIKQLKANTTSIQLEMGDVFNAIESYFANRSMRQVVRHQIESYNSFMNERLKQTIEMFNPVKIHANLSNETPPKHILEVSIEFRNFAFHRPTIHENNGATKIMFPQEARNRNFTYSGNMVVDVHITYTVTQLNANGEPTTNEFVNTLPGINIGKMPIMLKSDGCILTQYSHFGPDITMECRHDPGGYFIINGSEKTVLGQERVAENKVYTFKQTKPNSKWLYVSDIKSIPSDRCISPKHISMMISNKSNEYGYPIMVQLPRLKQPVPLYTLFRALGVMTDKAITKMLLVNVESEEPLMKTCLEFLTASMYESASHLTQASALSLLASYAIYIPINMDRETGQKKKQEYTNEIIANDLFPHCATQELKVKFLGYMANQLMMAYMKQIPCDDRDSYDNKRVDTTGMLLNNLFRNYLNKLVKDLQKATLREINQGSWRSTLNYANIINMTNIYKLIKTPTIENGIKRALSTGDFGIKNLNSNKVGVAQVLNRMTYISSLSHLRRINTPIDKSGKLIPPRQLHPSSWGFLCPAETPEGQSVGVVKNLSFMTHITTMSWSGSVTNIIQPHLYEDPIYELNITGVKVLVNGSWIGIAKDPPALYSLLKDKKCSGQLNIYTSIVFVYSRREIRVCNEAGRMCRPLFRVKDGKLLYTKQISDALARGELGWNDLLTGHKLDTAVVEYLDAEEQMHANIAMKPRDLNASYTQYTHCEMHPCTIFGVLASCIPFPEHNQSPRLTYQCAMGKQAMGVYVTNYSKRMDKTAYVLTTPMRPLVDTRLMTMLQLDRIPSGSQVIVAIMTHTGYNQEDSIIFNGGSVDRGLFHATLYHTEKDEEKKVHGDEEIRCKPDPSKTRGMRHANYGKLDATGNIPVNTLLEDRDIIIGKVMPIKENKNDNNEKIKYEDHSRTYRTDEEAYVDDVYTHRNGEGYKFNKVRVRISRTPVVGDKFSSRGAQKGTIGTILPEADVPFTANGIKPDIIINPHCMPSRMTIGQLKETLLGKVLVELGLFGDGTSFTELNMDVVREELRRCGYHSSGDEVLYDGVTGERIEMPIFMGPTFYQRLKHMVSDKCHSRNIGPMVAITRQPAEGRSRDGGLRFGEMERDCVISHGAANFVKTRMYDCSDKYQIHVCRKCGITACYNHEMHIHRCNLCGNTADFACVNIPYACKLMFQELMTMNVVPRIITESV